MKQPLLLLFFMAFVLSGFAENDSISTKKKMDGKGHAHYISVNGTFFLQQFFNFSSNNTIITPSPYIVEYKFLPKHHGFRFDVGGSFSQKKDFLDSSQIQINSTTSFNLRLGYIFQKKVSKKWSVFVGGDVVSTISKSTLRNNTVVDIVTTGTKSYAVGVGPSLGIQFAINNRIGLFTETAFYYQYVISKNEVTSLNFTDTNTSTKSIENSLKFVIPTSIFFYVRL